MQYRKNKIRSSEGMTLVETIVALAIMAIIFAAVLPQLRVIQNSWDTKMGASETLQNGRILIDHINRNLSKALRITAVSDSSETNGYIEFLDNDANNVRYDIGVNNYVEFGLVGNLNDLAGPVSQLLFTCYDGNDFTTPITDVNSIRFIKVQTTVTNSVSLGRDMAFSTQAYIRTNALPAAGGDISKLSEPWLEYNTTNGLEPAICQIDATHYLCAYAGPANYGWVVVLTVDPGTWNVSKEVAFEYDVKQGLGPALAKIDQTHYLCAYQGEDDDGWVRIFNVNTNNWTISEEDSIEFDQNTGLTPALVQIDQTHYLCAYQGPGGDGWAVVFSITAPLFDAITMETPFEFETSEGRDPTLAQIDSTHYLCAYSGPGGDGYAVVLTVNTGNWTISKGQAFEHNTSEGREPALTQIDSTHYLCTYRGPDGDGWAVILTVNVGNWTISKWPAFEYDTVEGWGSALTEIDSTHYLCAYQGGGADGWSVVLTVDSGTWNVSKGTPFEFDITDGVSPALVKIDNSHFLCAYAGSGSDGYAGVLAISEEILP